MLTIYDGSHQLNRRQLLTIDRQPWPGQFGTA